MVKEVKIVLDDPDYEYLVKQKKKKDLTWKQYILREDLNEKD